MSAGAIAALVGRNRTDRTVRRALDDLEAEGAINRDDHAGGWGVVREPTTTT